MITGKNISKMAPKLWHAGKETVVLCIKKIIAIFICNIDFLIARILDFFFTMHKLISDFFLTK